MALLTFLFKQDNFVVLPYLCLSSEIKPHQKKKLKKRKKKVLNGNSIYKQISVIWVEDSILFPGEVWVC